MDISAVHAVSPCQTIAVEQMVPFAEPPNYHHPQWLEQRFLFFEAKNMQASNTRIVSQPKLRYSESNDAQQYSQRRLS